MHRSPMLQSKRVLPPIRIPPSLPLFASQLCAVLITIVFSVALYFPLAATRVRFGLDCGEWVAVLVPHGVWQGMVLAMVGATAVRLVRAMHDLHPDDSWSAGMLFRWWWLPRCSVAAVDKTQAYLLDPNADLLGTSLSGEMPLGQTRAQRITSAARQVGRFAMRHVHRGVVQTYASEFAKAVGTLYSVFVVFVVASVVLMIDDALTPRLAVTYHQILREAGDGIFRTTMAYLVIGALLLLTPSVCPHPLTYSLTHSFTPFLSLPSSVSEFGSGFGVRLFAEDLPSAAEYVGVPACDVSCSGEGQPPPPLTLLLALLQGRGLPPGPRTLHQM